MRIVLLSFLSVVGLSASGFGKRTKITDAMRDLQTAEKKVLRRARVNSGLLGTEAKAMRRALRLEAKQALADYKNGEFEEDDFSNEEDEE